MTVKDLILGYAGYIYAQRDGRILYVNLDGNECDANLILSDKRFALKIVKDWGFTEDHILAMGTV